MSLGEILMDQIKTQPSKIDEDEKVALRIYLQRCEVRLSTMHRIAGNFLGGAGLLALFPAFLQNTFLRILESIIQLLSSNLFVALLLSMALVVSLALPAYALYLLLREIVNFYFTPHHPGHANQFFHPRFILSGLSPAIDEVKENTRKEISLSEQREDMLHFVVPYAEHEQDYFQSIYKQTQGEIIPDSRRSLIQKDNKKNIQNFYTAFGLTGVVDRTLIDEVAKMEASLVRHALSLRRLLLRYVKSLIMFIWTTVLFTLLAGFIHSLNLHSAIVISAGFIIWGITTPLFVGLPIKWIYALEKQDRDKRKIQKDKQLIGFENNVWILSVIVVLLAGCAFAIAIFSGYLK